MSKNSSKIFAVLAAALMFGALADTSYAQRRVRRAVYSQQQVEQLLTSAPHFNPNLTMLHRLLASLCACSVKDSGVSTAQSIRKERRKS